AAGAGPPTGPRRPAPRDKTGAQSTRAELPWTRSHDGAAGAGSANYVALTTLVTPVQRQPYRRVLPLCSSVRQVQTHGRTSWPPHRRWPDNAYGPGCAGPGGVARPGAGGWRPSHPDW